MLEWLADLDDDESAFDPTSQPWWRVEGSFPPVPWYKCEGSRIVGRIDGEIVEVYDLESVTKTEARVGFALTKPTTRDHVERMAAMFAEPGRLAELLRSVADHVEQRNGDGVTRPATSRQRETVMERGYLSLRELAHYCGRSKRWLEDRIKDTDHPLPVHRLGGKLSVKISEFEQWAHKYRQVGNRDLNKIVSDVMSSL